MREPGDFESAVEYILTNPVKAGLASNWENYPLLVGDHLTGDNSTV